FDDVLREHGLKPNLFELLVIDVQGAEALVLKGAMETLRHVKAIAIEVNFVDMYRGGAQIDEIDDILGHAGFERAQIASGFHPTCGRPVYVRPNVRRPTCTKFPPSKSKTPPRRQWRITRAAISPLPTSSAGTFWMLPPNSPEHSIFLAQSPCSWDCAMKQS